jgi:hypothetical protein
VADASRKLALVRVVGMTRSDPVGTIAHGATSDLRGRTLAMSRIHQLALGLTLLNLVLLLVLILGRATPALGSQTVAPVLRGRALEIVDDQGRVRANILIHGPETVNHQTYPETVLFRLIDPKSGPLVKLTVSTNGSALGLSNGLSDYGGVQLYARDTASFVRVVDRSGRTQVVRP